ncbi:hypothetical protein ACVILE_002232 [Streptomyces sp. M18.1]
MSTPGEERAGTAQEDGRLGHKGDLRDGRAAHAP